MYARAASRLLTRRSLCRQRAPNTSHLHREMLRRLKHLHQYDVLRCDRATSCHGLEIRVPFVSGSLLAARRAS